MKMLFLALLAFTGYRLAVGIGRENAAESLLRRDPRAAGWAPGPKRASPRLPSPGRAAQFGAPLTANGLCVSPPPRPRLASERSPIPLGLRSFPRDP
jgi:hypothetical protein